MTRDRMVPLEWPIEHYGMVYDTVRVHRVTLRQFFDWGAASINNPHATPPCFDLPSDVWNSLDVDDVDRLQAAALEFLPSRYCGALGIQNG